MASPIWLNAKFWIDVSWGFFLLGVLFVIIALFSSMDHDVDHDVDTGEAGFDHDVGFDFGDFGENVGYIQAGHGAPLTLLLGTFFLTYGGSGLAMFMISNNVILNVLAMLSIAIIAIVSMNLFFKVFFKTGSYQWRPEMCIGRRAVVVFEVNATKGTIKVDTGTPLGVVKYPARSADPNKSFKPGEVVYVVDWREGIAVVDNKPRR